MASLSSLVFKQKPKHILPESWGMETSARKKGDVSDRIFEDKKSRDAQLPVPLATGKVTDKEYRDVLFRAFVPEEKRQNVTNNAFAKDPSLRVPVDETYGWDPMIASLYKVQASFEAIKIRHFILLKALVEASNRELSLADSLNDSRTAFLKGDASPQQVIGLIKAKAAGRDYVRYYSDTLVPSDFKALLDGAAYFQTYRDAFHDFMSSSSSFIIKTSGSGDADIMWVGDGGEDQPPTITLPSPSPGSFLSKKAFSEKLADSNLPERSTSILMALYTDVYNSLFGYLNSIVPGLDSNLHGKTRSVHPLNFVLKPKVSATFMDFLITGDEVLSLDPKFMTGRGKYISLLIYRGFNEQYIKLARSLNASKTSLEANDPVRCTLTMPDGEEREVVANMAVPSRRGSKKLVVVYNGQEHKTSDVKDLRLLIKEDLDRLNDPDVMLHTAVNSTIYFSFKINVPEHFTRAVTQTATGKISLSGLRTWLMIWQKIKFGKDKKVKKVPKYILPYSQLAKNDMFSSAPGTDASRTDEHGMAVDSKGCMIYVPKISEDLPARYEKILDELLEQAYANEEPFSLSRTTSDPIYRIHRSTEEQDARNEKREALKRFKLMPLASNWNANVVLFPSKADLNIVKDVSLDGSMIPDTRTLADWMGMPTSPDKEGNPAGKYPFGKSGLKAYGEMIGEPGITQDASVLMTNMFLVDIFYNWLMINEKVPTYEKLLDLSKAHLDSLNRSELITELDKVEAYSSIYAFEKFRQNTLGTQVDPHGNGISMFAKAIELCKYNSPKLLAVCGNIGNGMDIQDHPCYVDLNTMTLNDLHERLGLTLGGAFFIEMCKQINTFCATQRDLEDLMLEGVSIEPDFFMKALCYEDFSTKIMPQVKIWSTYMPASDDILISASGYKETLGKVKGFVPVIPGIKEIDPDDPLQKGFALQPHQVDTLSYSAKHPRFMILDIAPGGGKCLVGDTLIPTSKGILTHKEIWDSSETKVVDGFRNCKFDVITTEGRKRANKSYKTKGFTTKVVMSDGGTLQGLPEHKIWSLTDDYNFEFVKIGDIKVGTYIPRYIGTRLFPTEIPKFNFTPSVPKQDQSLHKFGVSNIPKILTLELSSLLGLLVSEGCGTSFYNSDPEILDHYLQMVESVFGTKSNVLVNRGTVKMIGLNSHESKEFIHSLGIGERSASKEVPKCIRTAPEEYQLEFLRALFEGDGSVHRETNCPRWTIEYYTISKSLAVQVKTMLENIGIFCGLKQGTSWATNGTENQVKKPKYTLSISKQSFHLFEEKIGFIGTKKSGKLMDCISHYDWLINDSKQDTNFYTCGTYNKIPCGELVYDLLSRISTLAGKISYKVPTTSTGAGGRTEHYTLMWLWRNLGIRCGKLGKRNKICTRNRVHNVEALIQHSPPEILTAIQRDEVCTSLLSKIQELIQYSWMHVTSKKRLRQVKEVYDISVPGPHNYVTQGLMSHNTILGLSEIITYLGEGAIKRPLVVMPLGLIKNWINDCVDRMQTPVNFIVISTETVSSWGLDELGAKIEHAPPNTIVCTSYSWLYNARRVAMYGTRPVSIFSNVDFLLRYNFDYVAADECFLGDTSVLIDYDKAVTMEEIYSNPEITHVLAYDLKKKKIVKKRILKKIRHEITKDDKWTRLTVNDSERSSTVSQYMTSNHNIFLSDHSEKAAGDILKGEELITYGGDFKKYRSCPHCNELVLKENNGLSAHLNSVHKDENGLGAKVCCPICNKDLNRGNVWKHILAIHEPESEKAKAHFDLLSKRLLEFNQTVEGIECANNSSVRMTERNPMRNEEARSKMRKSLSDTFWSKPEEERNSQIERFMAAPLHSNEAPNHPEQRVIDLDVSGLYYTGNGIYHVKLDPRGFKNKCKSPCSGKKHSCYSQDKKYSKNPDFIYAPAKCGTCEYFKTVNCSLARPRKNGIVCSDYMLSKTFRASKVVEVMDMEYWHCPDKAILLKKMYKRAGIKCLVIDAKMDKEKARGKIEAFVNNHYVKVTTACDSHFVDKHPEYQYKYDLTVEDAHNYFVLFDRNEANNPVPVLVHNCHRLKGAGISTSAGKTKDKKEKPTSTHLSFLRLVSNKHVKYVRLLTGTLIKNTLLDLVGQVRLMNPAIFRTGADFKREYGDPNVALESAGGRRVQQEIRKYLEEFVTVVKKRKKDWAYVMPEFIDKFDFVDPTDAAIGYYEWILKKTLEQIRAEMGEKEFKALTEGKKVVKEVKKKKGKKDTILEEEEDISGNDDDDDIEVGEVVEDEPSDTAGGDDEDMDSIEAQLKPYLQRLEQSLTDPEGDPEFESFERHLAEAGTKIVLSPTRKVVKVYEILEEHFKGAPVKIDPVTGVTVKDAVDAMGNLEDGVNGNKVLIFCKYHRSVDAVYKHMPAHLKKYARKYRAGKKSVLEDFILNSDIKILVALEDSLQEGYNLQVASRLIRVEQVWTPGEFEQGVSRVHRPDIGNRYGRTHVISNWIIVNRSLEVAKIGRLISKFISAAKFYEDGEKYQQLDAEGICVPIKMSLEVITGIDKNGDPSDLGKKDWSDVVPYLEAYGMDPLRHGNVRGLAQFQQEDFDEARRLANIDGSDKMTPVKAAPMMEGSKFIKQLPYIMGQSVYDPNDLGLIPLKQWIDETPEAQLDLDKAIKGLPIHTAYGEGVIQHIKNKTVRKKKDKDGTIVEETEGEESEGFDAEGRPKKGKVVVRLGTGNGIEKLLSMDVIFVITKVSTNMKKLLKKSKGVTSEDTKPVAPPKPVKKAPAGLTAFLDNKLKNLKGSIKKPIVEEPIIKQSKKLKIVEEPTSILEKLKSKKKEKETIIKPTLTPTKDFKKNLALDVFAMDINGMPTLMLSHDDPDSDAIGKKLGFVFYGSYMFAEIKNAKILESMRDALENEGFVLTPNTDTVLSKVQATFKGEKNKERALNTMSKLDKRVFFDPKTFKKRFADPAKLRLFPIVEDKDRLCLYLNLSVGDPAALRLKKMKKIPGVPQITWNLASGHWVFVAPTKGALINKLSQFKSVGIKITNLTQVKESINELF